MFSSVGHEIFDGLLAVGTNFALLVMSLAGILFTAYVGANLARSWQLRNWTIQQRVSDQDRINVETRKLFDDFVNLASRRHFRTKRLLWALKSGDAARIEECLREYDKSVIEWNESELSWDVRFVKNLDHGTRIISEINAEVRVPFVEIGRTLERRVKHYKKEKNIEEAPAISTPVAKELEVRLSRLSRAIFETGRSIYAELDHLDKNRLDSASVVRLAIDRGKFDELSIAQLFRAATTSTRSRLS